MSNKSSKRYVQAAALVEQGKTYSLAHAVTLLKKFPAPKFDGTVTLSAHLGVDPRKSDQMVRGSVALPHGTGKSIKVIVFAQGDAAKAALEAGADEVGFEDLNKKVQGGYVDFDSAIATPDAMTEVRKVARVLGPRGLSARRHQGLLFAVGHGAEVGLRHTHAEQHIVDLGRTLGRERQVVVDGAPLVGVPFDPYGHVGVFLHDLRVLGEDRQRVVVELGLVEVEVDAREVLTQLRHRDVGRVRGVGRRRPGAGLDVRGVVGRSFLLAAGDDQEADEKQDAHRCPLQERRLHSNPGEVTCFTCQGRSFSCSMNTAVQNIAQA